MEHLSLFESFAVLSLATGLAEVINARFLKLPFAMGLVLLSLVTVGIAWGLSLLGVRSMEAIQAMLPSDSALKEVFIDSSLALMLYAAATSMDRRRLRSHLLPVLFLATVGVVLSTAMVAVGVYQFGPLVGFEFTIPAALLFGAIIAPTDALAIKPILERFSGKRAWKTVLEGESLLNDAMALVLVVTFANWAGSVEATPGTNLVFEFAREAFVAVVIGAGMAIFIALAGALVNERNSLARLLLSIALATASYTLALRFDASGPVAVVTAGLVIKELIHQSASVPGSDELNSFWLNIERLFASMFCFLIGLELATIGFQFWMLGLALIAWLLVLAARFLTVGLSFATLSVVVDLGKPHHFIGPMTLAGVRGAISIALALSLPESVHREPIVVMTFGAVVLGLLVQGGVLLRQAGRWSNHEESELQVRQYILAVLNRFRR